MVDDAPGDQNVYVITARTSTGFRRRLFFAGPPGMAGAEALRELSLVAHRLGAEAEDMAEYCAALEAIAAEHDMSRIAH